MTKGNSEKLTATCTRRQGEALNRLDRIREAARRDKNLRFTSLMHHITVDLLRDSFKALKRDVVPGVDNVTWRQYGEELETHLPDLHERVQSGRYRAKPSKRTWIPKSDGRQRPIGIAALEDKVVQQAVVRVLNQIFEEDFLGFSYGFRPGRNQHNALDALWVGITQRKVNWVLDADIRSFYDTIDHGWLVGAVRLIQHYAKRLLIHQPVYLWLNSGVSQSVYLF
jgi:RNA-directed DNA polymerase